MKTNITVHVAGDLKLAPEWRQRDWMLSNEFCISVTEKTKPNADEEEREVSGARGTQAGMPSWAVTPTPGALLRSLCLGV